MKPAKLLAKRLTEIDPMTAMSRLLPAIMYYFEGRFEKAFESGKKGYEQHPDDPVILFYLAVFSAAWRRQKESYDLFDLNFQKNSGNIYARLSLLFKYALNGAQEMVSEGISKYVSDVAVGDEELSIWMADIYALIGENELAVKWIQNAAKKGFINYSFFKKYDPFLKNIRKDPRFLEALEDIKVMNKAFRE
jgi:tetratricopeptide (TPR) repeat protein